MRTIIVVLLAAALLKPSFSEAQIIVPPPFVVTNTSDSGSGTLRQALLDANARPGPDVIAFGVTGTITLTSGDLVIDDDVTIAAPGPALVSISGNDASRVFTINGSGRSVTFSGLTLTRGRASTGGALAVVNGDFQTFVSLSNCVLSGNTAVGGEGGAIRTSGAFTGGTLALYACTISNNVASANGGGIDSPGATITISRCTVSGNLSHSSGGGISMGSGNLTIENSTLSGNQADEVGGGLNSNYSASIVLRNCTIADNVAGQVGGGIRNISFNSMRLQNNIVARNLGLIGSPDMDGSFVSLGHNLFGNSEGANGLFLTDI